MTQAAPTLTNGFDALIPTDWKLKREGSYWQVSEPGHLFIEWAAQLLRFHGHCANDYTFFGIVSLKPRNQPRKGTSRRCAELPAPEPSPHGSHYPVFVLANHPRVSIADVVKKLDERHTSPR